LQYRCRRDFGDNLECWFRFSVLDSSLIGTPRKVGSIHTLSTALHKFAPGSLPTSRPALKAPGSESKALRAGLAPEGGFALSARSWKLRAGGGCSTLHPAKPGANLRRVVLRVTLTDPLMNNWKLTGAEWSVVTEDMVKVASACFTSPPWAASAALDRCQKHQFVKKHPRSARRKPPPGLVSASPTSHPAPTNTIAVPHNLSAYRTV